MFDEPDPDSEPGDGCGELSVGEPGESICQFCAHSRRVYYRKFKPDMSGRMVNDGAFEELYCQRPEVMKYPQSCVLECEMFEARVKGAPPVNDPDDPPPVTADQVRDAIESGLAGLAGWCSSSINGLAGKVIEQEIRLKMAARLNDRLMKRIQKLTKEVQRISKKVR